MLADLVVAQTIGPLGLNLNFDYVTDKDAGIDGFTGVAVMAHYSVSDKLTASARFEYARNGDPTHVKLIEGTFGLGVPLGGRFEFRPEVRVDNASQPNFDPLDAGGTAPGQDPGHRHRRLPRLVLVSRRTFGSELSTGSAPVLTTFVKTGGPRSPVFAHSFLD